MQCCTGKTVSSTITAMLVQILAVKLDLPSGLPHPLPIAKAYAPDLVLVSAGFDAAAGDPLGEMEVSPSMFGRMCRQ